MKTSRWILVEDARFGDVGPRLVAIYDTFESAFEGWERRFQLGDYYLEEWIL